jgi:hypothetical protein
MRVAGAVVRRGQAAKAGARVVFAGVVAAATGTVCGCGSRVWDAAAVAGVAGAVELAQVAAADRAEREAWMPHEGCDRFGAPACYVATAMTLEEARAHVEQIVNLVRAQDGAPPLAADFAVTAFAQDGSKDLARDHLAHGHIASDPGSCPGCSETQGDPNGCPEAAVESQLDSIVDAWFRDGPGGANHDLLVSRRWHRIGVGVANPDGPLFLTVDVAP